MFQNPGSKSIPQDTDTVLTSAVGQSNVIMQPSGNQISLMPRATWPVQVLPNVNNIAETQLSPANLGLPNVSHGDQAVNGKAALNGTYVGSFQIPNINSLYGMPVSPSSNNSSTFVLPATVPSYSVQGLGSTAGISSVSSEQPAKYVNLPGVPWYPMQGSNSTARMTTMYSENATKYISLPTGTLIIRPKKAPRSGLPLAQCVPVVSGTSIVKTLRPKLPGDVCYINTTKTRPTFFTSTLNSTEISTESAISYAAKVRRIEATQESAQSTFSPIVSDSWISSIIKKVSQPNLNTTIAASNVTNLGVHEVSNKMNVDIPSDIVKSSSLTSTLNNTSTQVTFSDKNPDADKSVNNYVLLPFVKVSTEVTKNSSSVMSYSSANVSIADVQSTYTQQGTIPSSRTSTAKVVGLTSDVTTTPTFPKDSSVKAVTSSTKYLLLPASSKLQHNISKIESNFPLNFLLESNRSQTTHGNATSSSSASMVYTHNTPSYSSGSSTSLNNMCILSNSLNSVRSSVPASATKLFYGGTDSGVMPTCNVSSNIPSNSSSTIHHYPHGVNKLKEQNLSGPRHVAVSNFSQSKSSSVEASNVAVNNKVWAMVFPMITNKIPVTGSNDCEIIEPKDKVCDIASVSFKDSKLDDVEKSNSSNDCEIIEPEDKVCDIASATFKDSNLDDGEQSVKKSNKIFTGEFIDLEDLKEFDFSSIEEDLKLYRPKSTVKQHEKPTKIRDVSRSKSCDVSQLDKSKKRKPVIDVDPIKADVAANKSGLKQLEIQKDDSLVMISRKSHRKRNAESILVNNRFKGRKKKREKKTRILLENVNVAATVGKSVDSETKAADIVEALNTKITDGSSSDVNLSELCVTVDKSRFVKDILPKNVNIAATVGKSVDSETNAADIVEALNTKITDGSSSDVNLSELCVTVDKSRFVKDILPKDVNIAAANDCNDADVAKSVDSGTNAADIVEEAANAKSTDGSSSDVNSSGSYVDNGCFKKKVKLPSSSISARILSLTNYVSKSDGPKRFDNLFEKIKQINNSFTLNAENSDISTNIDNVATSDSINDVFKDGNLSNETSLKTTVVQPDELVAVPAHRNSLLDVNRGETKTCAIDSDVISSDVESNELCLADTNQINEPNVNPHTNDDSSLINSSSSSNFIAENLNDEDGIYGEGVDIKKQCTIKENMEIVSPSLTLRLDDSSASSESNANDSLIETRKVKKTEITVGDEKIARIENSNHDELKNIVARKRKLKRRKKIYFHNNNEKCVPCESKCEKHVYPVPKEILNCVVLVERIKLPNDFSSINLNRSDEDKKSFVEDLTSPGNFKKTGKISKCNLCGYKSVSTKMKKNCVHKCAGVKRRKQSSIKSSKQLKKS